MVDRPHGSPRYPDNRCARCGFYGCILRHEGRGVDFYYCRECLPGVAEEYGWNVRSVMADA